MMMRLPGRLGSLARRAQGVLGPRVVILLYHRVADGGADPYRLRVSPRHFEEHLEVIQEMARPVTVGSVATALDKGTLPARSVAVTFDDAYQDNLGNAAPLLHKHGVPATFFATTGDAGRVREFWWDELERIFMHTPALPPRLRVDLPDLDIDLDMDSDLDVVSDREAPPATPPVPPTPGVWTIVDPPPTSRHRAFQVTYGLLQKLDHVAQLALLDALLDWACATRTARPGFRALDADGLRALDADRLMEIGAHTHSHPALSQMGPTALRDEIAGSRKVLEAWLGHRVESFAYPYGIYSAEAVAEVRRAGYRYACACMGWPVRLDSEMHLLPRIDVPDVDGDGLAAILRRALGRT